MKVIYGFFKLLLAIAMMTFGVLMVFFQFEEVYGVVDDYYEQLLEQAPDWLAVRPSVAVIIAFVGLLVLISMFPARKKKRTISFAGMHGEVTIELDDVETTLERVATKLPEVRSAAIRLEPTDSPGRVRVIAKVVLLKNADDEARMVTARVQHYLQIHTRRILGLSEVDVQLNVKKFQMNMKTVKPEPLLLEGPAAEAMGMAFASDNPNSTAMPADPDVGEVSPAEAQEDEADRV